MENEEKYTQGFNSGYLLAHGEPELLAAILKNPNDHNEYFQGLLHGKNEYEIDKAKNPEHSMEERITRPEKDKEDHERDR